MKNIKLHIEKNEQIIVDPTISSQRRRYIGDELEQLQRYHNNHPDDCHDPSCLELYCEDSPDVDECKMYDE